MAQVQNARRRERDWRKEIIVPGGAKAQKRTVSILFMVHGTGLIFSRNSLRNWSLQDAISHRPIAFARLCANLIGPLRPFDCAQDSSSTAFSSESVEESGRTVKGLISNESFPARGEALEP
jgi:hypothetical protein